MSSIIDILKQKQQEVYDNAKKLSGDEFVYICEQYEKRLVEQQEQILKDPFNPKVIIPVKNLNIFEDDIAITMLHTNLVNKFTSYYTDEKDWIIQIVFHANASYTPLPRYERTYNKKETPVSQTPVSQTPVSQTPVSQTPSFEQINISHIEEQLKKITKERNDLKSKLSELSFDNEVMRQEFQQKLIDQEFKNKETIERIYAELREHNQKMMLGQSNLIDLHTKQVDEIEKGFLEEKKSDTLKIQKLQEMVEKIRKTPRHEGASEPKIAPPVGRIPKPLSSIIKKS